ncbi:uncharacterized protein [Diabrotica undecimpunctata]|uniref:uncharacterized protein n=1 Tax=Diabrotica undecimpunctata TaxID=50387 RepID=UPI003B63E707
MDIEKLIACVQENKCLWNMREKHYHNRDVCRQSWEKVASQLDTSSETAKTKWRGLRDTFRKELSKYPEKRSGDEGGIIKESKWAYFRSMEFLKDQFQKRQLQGNVPRPTQPTSDSEEETHNSPFSFPPDPAEDEPDSHTKTLVSPHNTVDETTPPQAFSAPKKKVAKINNATIVRKLMDFEEEKLRMIKERNSSPRNDDPDYHFLMSLLPYLRKVPDDRKLYVRTKLQQVFCEEEERFGGKYTPQPIHHPTHTFSTYSSTSDSQQDDLTSSFSNVTPDDKHY